MIDDIKRLAGPYTSAGQKDLAFGFLIFEPTDVYVAKAESADSVITHTLSYGSDYTVSMNSDQSATPGGTVTLTTPIAEGQVVVVGSAIAYTQTTQLTNFSRFPPEIINTALDRIVVQIQQLVEKIGRVVSVPETSTTTPEEMLDRLLSAASDAAASASSAAASAQTATEMRDEVLVEGPRQIEAIKAEGATQVGAIQVEGATQVKAVTAEGDKQIARIEDAGNSAVVTHGAGCLETTWTVEAHVPAGTTITIPNTVKYIVGRHHLRLSWNGLVLYGGSQFNEIGVSNKFSDSFSLTFDLRAGDEMNAWVATLGSADAAEAIATAAAAEQAVADLSRAVVYKNEEAAQGQGA